ncbi:MAG: peptidylprolyl isomerase [Thermoanaerobaculia bacterium]
MTDRVTAAVLVCAALGCASPGPEEGVVAEWKGGSLTAAEVDAALVERPASERPAPGADLETWYETSVRELAFDRILLASPELALTRDSPEWLARVEEVRRAVAYRVFLERLPPVPAPTPEEVREAFAQRADARHRPETRLVSHIFLRVGERRSAAEARTQLEAIRRRVLAGESFAQLAADLSESETRHRRGEIGWMSRDQLGSLADLVFSLPPRRPSEPFLTPEGGHLFYVDAVTAERDYELAEVESRIVETLRRERLAAAVIEAAEALPAPPGEDFVPDSEELAGLLAGGQPDTLVLRVGDYRLDLAGLRGSLEEAGETGDPVERARRRLEYLQRRERVYEHALAEGWLEEPDVARRLETVLDRELLQYVRTLELRRLVAESPEAVQAYYAKRRHRFMEPLQVELRDLHVPFEPGKGNDLMRRLEAAAPEVSAGRTTLESLQRELGGEIDEIGWVTIEQLSGVAPVVALQTAELGSTGCLSPVARGGRMHLVEVTDRREPVERSLAEAREEVEAAFLEENRDSLHERMRAAALEKAGFRLVVDDLAAVLGRVAG